jgi:hypothetical protein
MISATLLAGALALAVPATAQEPPPAPPEQIRRLEQWPELDRSAQEQVRVDIQRLRKARTPEMAEEAEAALKTTGAAVVPRLLPTLGKERDEEALERIERVLLAVTGPEHTRLLAEWFEDKSVEVRSFALRRCGAFPDEGVRAAAEAALARVLERGDKADAGERYAAALAVTAAGSLEAFDLVADSARTSWTKRGEELRAALEAVRGRAASERATALLGGERDDVLAGLGLLSGCGDEHSTAAVKPFLDSDDHQVRVAAINALRGIVDGEGPLDKLPVFEAIELAKRWKGRV